MISVALQSPGGLPAPSLELPPPDTTVTVTQRPTEHAERAFSNSSPRLQLAARGALEGP